MFGYKGKQVRDAIHSHDLIRAFDAFFRAPRVAEVYNIGGGRFSNASVLEAIELAQEIAGRELDWTYEETNRIGDHIWWIGDNGRFEAHYPELAARVRRPRHPRGDPRRQRRALAVQPPQPQRPRAEPYSRDRGARRIRSTKASYSRSAFSGASFDSA